MDKKYCIEYGSNFCNGNNPYGIRSCWHLESARLVKRYAAAAIARWARWEAVAAAWRVRESAVMAASKAQSPAVEAAAEAYCEAVHIAEEAFNRAVAAAREVYLGHGALIFPQKEEK